MTQIYLSGALSEADDPFEWHDEIQDSDRWDEYTFVNPYTLNDFDLGDDTIYEKPEKVVEPALSELSESDGLFVRWDDAAFHIGTTMEIKHAWENDIPVVIWYDGYMDNLSPWLDHTTRGVFSNRNKALSVLLGFADTEFDFSK